MTESKTAEILNDGLGATIHDKTTKKTLVIQNLHIKIEQKRLASNLLHQNQTLFVIYKLVYIVLS